jgi:hypothetical protein
MILGSCSGSQIYEQGSMNSMSYYMSDNNLDEEFELNGSFKVQGQSELFPNLPEDPADK